MNTDIIMAILGGVNGFVAIFFQLKRQYDKATYFMVIAFGLLATAN